MKESRLKNIYNMITYNFKTLLVFEFLYKLIIGLIFIPAVIGIFNLTMRITGFTYLTIENILNFALNPITIIFLLFIIIFLTMVTIFDISTLIIIFDSSYKNKKISVMDSIKISLSKCKNIFKLKNISVAILVLFIIPFLNIGVTSNVITSIKIPEFIMDFINANKTLSIIFSLFYLFLLSILSKWLYSLHYMVIEGKSFKSARKSSKNLIKGNRFKDIIIVFLYQLISGISYILFLIIGIFILYILNMILGRIFVIKSILLTIVWMFMLVSVIIFTIISTGIGYSVISSLYYKHKIDKDEKLITIKSEEKKKNIKFNKNLKYAVIILWIFAIAGGSIFTYQVITGKANLNIEHTKKMEITAHRGASIKYPENTMAAFRGAKKLGADWIELDVQQTKDKQIVVSHDTNLNRVTGVNKDIIDMNYSEIKKLDAGSFFNKKFKGEKIPLLKDVLEFAKKNNIRLNIELKPTGKEKNFEKQVVDLIKEYNFEDRCVVTSQVYNVLKKIKKYDKDIKTVYVMSIAIGKITDAKYADAFSIKATNVTETQVSRVHNAGKEVYAWTVNKEESINKMIDMNVDNIITDNIKLGVDLVEKSKRTNIEDIIIKVLNY